MYRFFVTVFVFWLSMVPILQAQFLSNLTNPSISIVTRHPPSIVLNAERVALLAKGADAEELAAAITAHLVNSGQLDVVNRSEMETILTEHQLSWTDLADPQSVPELGKILGSTALLTVKVHRLTSETSKSHTKYDDYTMYTSTRTVHFKASVQTIDLSTGKVFGARYIERSIPSSKSSKDGYPDYPSHESLRTSAFRSAVTAVSRYYLPWSQSQKLLFFDWKKYDMKLAYQAFQAQDYEEAINVVNEALSQAQKEKAKPKHLSRLRYNRGVLFLFHGRFDDAIEDFRFANKIKPKKRYRNAMVTAKSAKQADARFKAYQAGVGTELQNSAPSGVSARAVGSQPAAKQISQEAAFKRLRALKKMAEEGLISEKEHETEIKSILAKMKNN